MPAQHHIQYNKKIKTKNFLVKQILNLLTKCAWKNARIVFIFWSKFLIFFFFFLSYHYIRLCQSVKNLHNNSFRHKLTHCFRKTIQLSNLSESRLKFKFSEDLKFEYCYFMKAKYLIAYYQKPLSKIVWNIRLAPPLKLISTSCLPLMLLY